MWEVFWRARMYIGTKTSWILTEEEEEAMVIGL
jgi:hypothetical protein